MVNYGVGQQFDFNADVFFYVVLPPIIFHQVREFLLLRFEQVFLLVAEKSIGVHTGTDSKRITFIE